MSEQPVGPARSVDPPVRYLDPTAVRRRAGRPEVAPTWYVADRLLVQGPVPDSIRRRLGQGEQQGAATYFQVADPEDDAPTTRLESEAHRQGCRLGVMTWGGRSAGAEADAGTAPAPDDELGFVLHLVPDRTDALPDAWEALEADGHDDDTSWRINLDHVMTAMPFTSHPFTSHPFTSHPFTSHPFTSHPFTSHPFTSHPFTSHPFTSHPFTSHGLPEYGIPGSGGRSPVQWLGPAPSPRASAEGDPTRTDGGALRPVVAIVDTGIGSHPWFGDYSLDPEAQPSASTVVIRGASLPDGPVGTYPVPRFPEEDAEIGGTSTAPLTGPLDPIAGHGTFIAGIVHQVCPDARLLPVRAVGGSGMAVESEVIESLDRLYRYHRRGLAGDDDASPVDVVVLAMGYYHEEVDDLRWDRPLQVALARLRDAGVAVVVAAGNDGETRPEYPAAFGPEVDRTGPEPRITCPKDTSATRPPILVVGALNPDGSTALFSNDGPWVTCLRYGAAVVSSLPTTLDGPRTPSVRLKERRGPGVRTTIDPEGFQGGFATWSGTSFAAPVLAGEIARELLRLRGERRRHDGATLARSGDRAPREVEDRVATVWQAITAATGGLSYDDAPSPG
ncbi:hypothetical protein GCM10009809_09430 [Isoptericola hypogeus]|uniref:Peptidase S8/S53 domain-containing protein n=1 Tax=Isoptericola hypogeus TaxID=300179 RepID=A0ABN2J157_9MICO